MRKFWSVHYSLLLLLGLALTFSSCGTLSSTSLKTAQPIVATRQPTGTATPTVQPTAVTNIALPVRLLIPTLGVDASVEQVGILPNGNLATPTGHPWDDVGWYDLGPRPGERGSVVIDGHLDRPGGYPAVFWNLSKLHSGDQVLVIDNQSHTFRYRVTQVAFYSPQAAPLQNIFGNNNGHYLNLITCAGDWIPSQHQTTLRLVVYTTLIT